MAVHAHGWLMLHAGVVPQWDLATTLALAGDLERALRDSPPREFLGAMFGNEPLRWRDSLAGVERLRFTLNTLTRIRFVADDGTLDFATKDGAEAAPPGYHAWFDAPGRRTAGTPIAFGHWSTLGLLDRPDVLGLDTGCVWGGKLTAARIDGARREIVQVRCAAAKRPGGKAHPARPGGRE
jgi:bis(5'-nucleosyl)-tetraphosphatase (symmetrical)